MKTPYIVAFLVIVISMGVMLFAFSSAVAQHVTIAQAIAHPNETVQVPGKILKNTVAYGVDRSSGSGSLTFDMIGFDPATRKEEPSQLLHVVYNQPKPENFNDADQVEAIGEYRDGALHADRLLVKCPSKYNDAPKYKK